MPEEFPAPETMPDRSSTSTPTNWRPSVMPRFRGEPSLHSPDEGKANFQQLAADPSEYVHSRVSLHPIRQVALDRDGEERGVAVRLR